MRYLHLSFFGVMVACDPILVWVIIFLVGRDTEIVHDDNL